MYRGFQLIFLSWQIVLSCTRMTQARWWQIWPTRQISPTWFILNMPSCRNSSQREVWILMSPWLMILNLLVLFTLSVKTVLLEKKIVHLFEIWLYLFEIIFNQIIDFLRGTKIHVYVWWKEDHYGLHLIMCRGENELKKPLIAYAAKVMIREICCRWGQSNAWWRWRTVWERKCIQRGMFILCKYINIR